MTGFLAAIAARAVGAPAPLRPRREPRYGRPDQPGAEPLLPVVHEQVDATGRALPPAPHDDTQARAPSSGASATEGRLAPHITPQAGAAQRQDSRRPDGLAEGEDSRARRAARAAAQQAARLRREHSGPEPVDPASFDPAPLDPDTVDPDTADPQWGGSGPGAARQPPMQPGRADRDAQRRPATVAGADLGASGTDAPEVSSLVWPRRPLGDSATTADVAPVGGDRDRRPVTLSPEPVPAAGLLSPRAGSGPPPARRGPPREAPAVDLAALLRTEVFAALADRGDVAPGEVPRVATTPASRAPRPGTAHMRAHDVRVEQSSTEPRGDADGDVHVHIGRVTVTRAAPSSPPAGRSEPARPLPDHAGYLARRRERG